LTVTFDLRLANSITQNVTSACVMSRHENPVIKYCEYDSILAWWHYVEVDCMLTFRTFSMSPLARSPR